MKFTKRLFLIITIISLVLSFSDCTKKEIFKCNYEGSLYLYLSNSFPSFSETSSEISVSINKYGDVTLGSGVLTYDATEEKGDIKVQRTGTIRINPISLGSMISIEDTIDINENANYEETYKQWIKNNGSWMLVANENYSGVWDGGLSFSLSEAQLSGSTITATSSMGKVVWILTLLPALTQ